MADPVARRRYGLIVGLEFGLLGAGAAVLGAIGQSRWIAVWICFGVGVHFFPLASTLANRSLRLLGVLLVAVAAAALTAGAGFGDGAVNSHRRRGWAVPPRFRPGYLADRRPGPSRGKRACSALKVRRWLANVPFQPGCYAARLICLSGAAPTECRFS
jgi:hypothetical protein